jgi:hypothetical protein
LRSFTKPCSSFWSPSSKDLLSLRRTPDVSERQPCWSWPLSLRKPLVLTSSRRSLWLDSETSSTGARAHKVACWGSGLFESLGCPGACCTEVLQSKNCGSWERRRYHSRRSHIF